MPDPEIIEVVPEVKSPEVVKEDAELMQDLKLHEHLKSRKSRLFFTIAAAAGIGLIAIIMVTVVGIFKLDVIFFPVSLNGQILDFAKRPLGDVKICVQNSCVNTDNSGDFSIKNLTYGKYVVTAELHNYKPINEEVELSRGTNKFSRNLSALGIGDLSGMLKTEGSNFISKDLKISVDSVALELDGKNSFLAPGLIVGTHKLLISSPNYLDIAKDVDIKEGSNSLADIVLQPALDLNLTVVDWLSGSPLTQVTAKIGEVKFTTDTNGKIAIPDRAITSKLTILVDCAGYNTKNIEIEDPAAGLNELNTVEMVRSGRIVYISSRLGNKNIYSSNYDGSDEKLLTDNKGDNEKPELLGDGNTVGFLSTRDNAKDAYGSTINLPYTVPVNGGKLTKIAKANYTDNGNIGTYSFAAGKRVYTLSNYVGGVTFQDIYLGNIDGTGSAKVASKLNGYIQSSVITNNGDTIILSWTGVNNSESGVYTVNPKNGTFNKIYSSGENYAYVLDTTTDHKSVLIKVVENSSYRSDLYSINLANGKSQRVTNTSTAELQARYGLDNNSAVYISTRDEKSDIFKVNLNGANEQRITSDGKVSGLLLAKGDLIFFTSEKSLFVMDSKLSGKPAKKVTDNITNDSYTIVDQSASGY